LPGDKLYVFDSSAVIAFLQRETGGEVVAGVLRDPGTRSFIHALNACEVYYDIYRLSGEEDASSLPGILAITGI